MEKSYFVRLAQSVLELDRALDQLSVLADTCGVPSPEHRQWYALLKHKLIPQLSENSFLIVAVMGGTNTGKSLIFNQLAGGHLSAVDHRASGTKHPVCLIPETEEIVWPETVLSRHFDLFRLVPWSNASQPLTECETHHLYWSVGQKVPKRLFLLDTPDIDSDREVNWQRATAIRDAADVLVAVLTSQKYNDAAVRSFFRKAVESKKPVIVLFNMFDMQEDIESLPHWIEQFRDQTGAEPLAIIVAPHDRDRAACLNVPFYAAVQESNTRMWRIGDEIDLAKILTDLHFDAIKSQTLLGAIEILHHPETGVRAYVDSVESASGRFADALRTLEDLGEMSVDWPALPSHLLVEEVRDWWHGGRPGWSRNINETYCKVGNMLLWPVRKATDYVSTHYFGSNPARSNVMEDFHTAENRAVFEFVEKIIYRLENLAETDNPVLKRELLKLVGGEHRSTLISQAHKVLASLEPVDKDFRNVLRRHLDTWSRTNPQSVGWGRSLDNAATIARPVITVTLALSGFALGAQVVSQMVGEVAVAGGVTAGGEAVIQAGCEGASRSIAKLFQKIQEDYVLARSKRFYNAFQNEIWKDVIKHLETGAEVANSEVLAYCKNWTKTK